MRHAPEPSADPICKGCKLRLDYSRGAINLKWDGQGVAGACSSFTAQLDFIEWHKVIFV